MCDVCKSKGKELFQSTIHKKNLEPITVKLCYTHDLELFKRGQETFLLKYRYELAALLNEALPVGNNSDAGDLDFT